MIRTVLATAASGVDRVFSAAVLSRGSASRRRSRAESLGHAERMAWLARIREAYERPEHFAEPDVFFPTGEADAVCEDFVRELPGEGAVFDASWASGCRPYSPEVAERYLACRENHTACARIYRHRGRARPAVILVHGYLGGRYAVEERVAPVRWFFDRGYDVALAVLPFHGTRGDPSHRRPLFPGSDPRITIEGFRQAIVDLRALGAHLRARGAPAVGAMGMSLGGYTTALLATVDPQLAFAVPMVPLASIADFARDNGRLVGTDAEQALQYDALEAAYRVVSPFGRASRVPAPRVVVVAGEGDRITPVRHARRIAEHFGSRLATFHGGHLLQFGRGDAFRSVLEMLRSAGLPA